MVYILAFRAGQHGNGIAAIVFIESAGRDGGAHAWRRIHARHGLIVFVEAGIKLLGTALVGLGFDGRE